jgi:type IV pilus assembly protein PilA
MVVVAIIGILAAVAVPQFSKFQAKSRQSEAKSSLTALYTAEKGFNAEYAGYATNFQAFGYSPAGEVLYDVGFVAANRCATWAACAPNYAPGGGAGPVVANGATSSAATFCGAYNAAMNNAVGCRMRILSAANAIGYAAVTATVATTSQVFTAQAAAQIYAGFGTVDRWTMDHNKVLLQTSVGIP